MWCSTAEFIPLCHICGDTGVFIRDEGSDTLKVWERVDRSSFQSTTYLLSLFLTTTSAAFSPDDWPARVDGLIVHYNPDTSGPPLRRGVLHASSNGTPKIQWQTLMDSFRIQSMPMNHVSYHVPIQFDEAMQKDITARLTKAFELAFPHRSPATIKVFVGRHHTRGQDGTYISFYTPSNNVRASDIVTAVVTRNWNAAGHALGTPWYVGLQSSKTLHPVKFTGVPDTCKDEFIATLPSYLTESLDQARGIEVLDIWEVQSRARKDMEWKFSGNVVALVCFKRLACTGHSLAWYVQDWPGWYHFEEEHLIKLEYPGRFAFCRSCKHTAQDIDGPNRRHTDEACIRIICGNCGHNGHDSTKFDPTGYNKRTCEEGKERRSAERALKRQRLEEETAAQQTTQNGSDQQITENQDEGSEETAGNENEEENEEEDEKGNEVEAETGKERESERQRDDKLQSDTQVKTEATA